MQIPTYTAQSKRPGQSGNQFLTAQLNSSAMEAPGRATFESGKSLISQATQLGEWAFKKGKAEAEKEASDAAELYAVEVAGDSQKLQLLPNLDKAPLAFQKMQKKRAKQYRNKLSSRLAKSAFDSYAGKTNARANLEFNKNINARIVGRAKETSRKEVGVEVAIASDVNISADERVVAAEEALGIITATVSVFGAKTAGKNATQAVYDITAGTLTNLIKRAGSDPEAIIERWFEGNSDDIILTSGLVTENLSDKDQLKIYKSLMKAANSITKEREDKLEEAEKAVDEKNKLRFRQIINLNLNTPQGMAKGKELHADQLRAGGYSTVAQREAIEKMLGIGGSDTGVFRPKGQGNVDRFTQLLEQGAIAQLTLSEIAAAKPQLEFSQYQELTKDWERDKNSAEKLANQKFADTFGYFIVDASETHEALSKRSWKAARLALKNFMRDNPNAGAVEIGVWVDKYRNEVKAEFVDQANMTKIAQAKKRHSNLVSTDADTILWDGTNTPKVVKQVSNKLASIPAIDMKKNRYKQLQAYLRVIRSGVNVAGFD